MKLLTEFDTVKITDFGVSEILGSRDMFDKSVGSPAFMAPELLRGIDLRVIIDSIFVRNKQDVFINGG